MQPQTITLQIQGMDCTECAKTVQGGVGQLAGVQSCEINFATEKLTVTGSVPEEAVVGRVRDLGYDVLEPDQADNVRREEPEAPSNFISYLWRQRDTRRALIGAFLVLPGILLVEIGGLDILAVEILSLGALLIAGGPIAASAWRTLRFSRTININVLMTLAAIGAVIIGEYTEAAVVMVLFATGEALEGFTVGRARSAIRDLGDIAPTEATRIQTRGDRVFEANVPVTVLEIGDVIVVKPGEPIPMDGVVVDGASAVNQAPITGESRLVEKEMGDELFAGSINGHGALEVRVTRIAQDNTISRLVRLVEEAQENQAPAQRFVDRFAAVYTPAVVVLATMVAVLPPLLLGEPFLNPGDGSFGWLYRGLALLVVACPCALVISTPVSIISAIANAARNGLVFKGGAALETLSKIAIMAFDKTGTLTSGKPSVVRVRAADCLTQSSSQETVFDHCEWCDEVMALASAVERRSEHPLAHAVLSASEAWGIQERYPSASGVEALTGLGVAGLVDGRAVVVGSHAHFDANISHSPEQCALADADERRGLTPLLVGADGSYLGAIVVSDTVRPTAREAVDQLQRAGIQNIAMLTGDGDVAAQSIADETGITDVRARLLPEDKLSAVEELRDAYGPIAMVGDGINDAPALAAAEVGISMGAATGGAALATETGDITLMSDDLRRLPYAYRLSRAAMRTIRANVVFSIGIKLLFFVLVLLGSGTMWMAVLADVGAAILVTLNGMRLLRWKARD